MSPSRWLGLGAAFALLFAAPYLPFRTNYGIGLLVLAIMYGYMNLCWNIAGGKAGIFSLAHGAFWAIGAYTSTLAYQKLGLTPWLGMFLGALVAALTAAILSLAFRARVRGIYFAMISLALVFALQGLVASSPWMGGATGLFIPLKQDLANFSFVDKWPYATVITAMFAALVLFLIAIKEGRLNDAWLAIREDENAAEALGIPTFRYRVIAMAMSAGLIALAGTFYAQYVLFISPPTVLGLEVMIGMLLGTMIGEIGTIIGPILGAVFFVAITELIQAAIPPSSSAGAAGGLIVYSAVLIVVIMGAPHGIAGLVRARMAKVRNQNRETTVSAKPFDVGRLAEALKMQHVTDFGAEILRVEGVCVNYGGVAALSNVSLRIPRGKIVAIIGPNGAGKSTLFNVLSGFVAPHSGEVHYSGKSIKGIPTYQLCRDGLVRTFQHVRLFSGSTVTENLRVGARARSKDIGRTVDDISHALGLQNRSQHLASQLTISEQKRLELGRALATKPEVICLDEIMAGLDHDEVVELSGLIRAVNATGVTVVLIEHVLKAVVNLADLVLVLDKGVTIAYGTPEQVMSEKIVVDSYLGQRASRGMSGLVGGGS